MVALAKTILLTLEVVQLLLEKESGDGRGQISSDTLSGAVGAVSSAEGVVDEDVGVGSKLLCEGLVVLLLLRVETNILEENDISLLHGSYGSGDGLTDAVRHKSHRLAKELCKTRGDGGKREFCLEATFRSAQVGRKDDLGALAGQVFDGGDSTSDTGIISDNSLLKGDVKVSADEDSTIIRK